MSVNTNANRTPQDLRKGITQRLVQVLGMMLFFGASLFLSAGTLRWPMAWVYMILYAALIALNGVVLGRRDPELIVERGTVSENTEPWDWVVGTAAMLMLVLGTMVVAGLDYRFGWAPELASWLVILGVALWVAGSMLFNWAMWTNRFFSSAVRIQADRGHRVVDTGPYNVVRHPGYVGAIVGSLGLALMLGSAWALIPGVIGGLLMALRTALEDRTLRERLPGYAEYATRVRYRLIPGLW